MLLGNRDRVRGGESRAVKTSVVDADAQAVNHRMAVPKGNALCAPSPTINRYAPYKNKLEQTFAYGLVLERRVGLIQAWAYEVMTLKLAKGKYHRPDFTIWHRDGSIEQAAVKGYHKNLRDSLTIIKWACKEHPWFRFTINRRDGSAWSKELVEV